MTQSNHDFRTKFVQDLNLIQKHACKEVNSYLMRIRQQQNDESVEFVINSYHRRLEKEITQIERTEMDQLVNRHMSHAFQIENTFIKDYLEQGLISKEVAGELREQISYDELIYLK